MGIALATVFILTLIAAVAIIVSIKAIKRDAPVILHEKNQAEEFLKKLNKKLNNSIISLTYARLEQKISNLSKMKSPSVEATDLYMKLLFEKEFRDGQKNKRR